ncbi:unnamed protein product [Cutaneotrichosporon oleaginosum]
MSRSDRHGGWLELALVLVLGRLWRARDYNTGPDGRHQNGVGWPDGDVFVEVYRAGTYSHSQKLDPTWIQLSSYPAGCWRWPSAAANTIAHDASGRRGYPLSSGTIHVYEPEPEPEPPPSRFSNHPRLNGSQRRHEALGDLCIPDLRCQAPSCWCWQLAAVVAGGCRR